MAQHGILPHQGAANCQRKAPIPANLPGQIAANGDARWRGRRGEGEGLTELIVFHATTGTPALIMLKVPFNTLKVPLVLF